MFGLTHHLIYDTVISYLRQVSVTLHESLDQQSSLYGNLLVCNGGSHLKVGVEIGGTFTDVIVLHDDGHVETAKVLSTPDQPQVGAITALQSLGFIDQVDVLVHASTVGTNAVITRRGARAGLITSQGFGDILEIQRHDRTEIYTPRYTKPEPIIPRDRVAEVVERVDATGNVMVPLDTNSVEEAVSQLVEGKDVDSIAVCLLFSFRHPEHERAIRETIQRLVPGCEVLLSSDVLPEIREYERASTSAIAAYLVPILKRYVTAMAEDLKRDQFTGDFYIMQSNGGILPAELIHTHAVYTLNSGPAAGVTGALHVVRRAGLQNAITLDMGGTSADVCLIVDKRAELSTDTKIDGLPIMVPMIDVVSIGAGGGSIAWMDEGTILKVGPQSAGSNPGPACYDLGGDYPTVTDANFALGLIRKAKFWGGRMELDLDRAKAALEELSPFMGGDYLHVADSIRRVVNSNMLQAIRLVSVERGFDPRDFYLIAFGGAGPLHAAELAAELGMRGALVPNYPGLLSAYGLVVADFQRDYVYSHVSSLSDTAIGNMQAVIEQLTTQARDEFTTHIHSDVDRLVMRPSLDMRYRGQAFELTVSLDETLWNLNGRKYLEDTFTQAHRQRYGYAMVGRPIDIVSYRLSAVAPESTHVPGQLPSADGEGVPVAGSTDQEEIFFGGQRLKCAFVSRETLPARHELDGPAVIEELSSTTFVPPGWQARVDDLGNIWLEIRELS
jgi:N-methylhydantoinase A